MAYHTVLVDLDVPRDREVSKWCCLLFVFSYCSLNINQIVVVRNSEVLGFTFAIYAYLRRMVQLNTELMRNC